MIVTRAEFSEHRCRRTLRLALIGMSNIGKSHWSGQIAKQDDFTCFEVDDAIQKKLGLTTMEQAAQWLGFPYQQGYEKSARTYLDLEAELTLSATEKHQAQRSPSCNLVLDTTGSFVHLDVNVLKQIKDNCLIVYLRANDSNFETLIDRFNTDPKPLIWGGYFDAAKNSPTLDGLMSCYPDLLHGREALYEQWADITLDVSKLKSTRDTDFLTALHDALPER